MRPGPQHIGTTGATIGDGLVYDPVTDEAEYGPVVQGLTSADGTVTISDNGDGTRDLAAAAGGGGGGGGGAGFTQLRKSANQTPGNNAWTMISWDVEDYDTLSLHNNATNNTRLTVPTGGAGVYLITYHIAIGTGTTDTYLQFSVNGVQVPGRVGPRSHSTNLAVGISRHFALSATDYVETGVYTNGQALKGGSDSCILTAFKVGTV